MHTEEQRAMQNPICQEFRRLSLKLSYLLRHRLEEGWEYYRKPTNPYHITLRNKRTTYVIWWFHNTIETVVCIDRRSRASRGITTDPNLKAVGCWAIGRESAIQQTIKALEDEGVIRKLIS